jgi:hypothetical protein
VPKLTPQRRSVFQDATIPKKRSAELGIAGLVDGYRNRERPPEYKWLGAGLLELARKK